MKKSILISLLCICVSSLSAIHSFPSDTSKKVTHHSTKKTKKHIQHHDSAVVTQPSKQHPNPLPIAPSFKEGQQAMLNFIKTNIVVPEEVKKNGINITVNVGFVVGIDGKLKNIRVLKMVGMGCDEEAERIVKLMPAWNPGKVGRVPTEMNFAIGIEFKN